MQSNYIKKTDGQVIIVFVLTCSGTSINQGWVLRAGPIRFEGMVAFSNVCKRVLGNAKAIDAGGAETRARASNTMCMSKC